MSVVKISKAFLKSMNNSEKSDPFLCNIFKILRENGIKCKNIQDAEALVKASSKECREKLCFIFSDLLKETTELINRKYLFDLMADCSVNKSETASLIVAELNREIEDERREEYYWWLCDCLYSLRVKKLEKEYAKFLSNENLGNGRQMLLLLLGAIKANNSVPAILKCLENEDINGHALDALYSVGYVGDYYIPFLDDERDWVRKTALKIKDKA